jgi:hypothetical protein
VHGEISLWSAHRRGVGSETDRQQRGRDAPNMTKILEHRIFSMNISEGTRFAASSSGDSTAATTPRLSIRSGGEESGRMPVRVLQHHEIHGGDEKGGSQDEGH